MLTSLQNPLIKQIRKLHRTKGRRSQQQFLLEGTHLVQEACAVAYPLTTVCYTPEWQARYPELWQQVTQQAQRIEAVSPEVMAAIATTVNPDGVVATAPRWGIQPHRNTSSSLGLVLETIQDPGNLGTMIRTATAAGASGLWLSSDSVDLDHPKVLRASAGQWFRLPMTVCDHLPSTVRQLQAEGVQVLATRPDAQVVYWEVDLCRPTLIMMGNEGAGLSTDLTEMADVAVSIPLQPGVESLNVAIAAALILYEAQRQRQTRG